MTTRTIEAPHQMPHGLIDTSVTTVTHLDAGERVWSAIGSRFEQALLYLAMRSKPGLPCICMRKEVLRNTSYRFYFKLPLTCYTSSVRVVVWYTTERATQTAPQVTGTIEIYTDYAVGLDSTLLTSQSEDPADVNAMVFASAIVQLYDGDAGCGVDTGVDIKINNTTAAGAPKRSIWVYGIAFIPLEAASGGISDL